MSTVSKQAHARGLGDCASLIDKMELPQAAPADAALGAPAATEPLAALDQARRRGLEPRLIDVLWRWLEPRPLELGLFAWDVLSNALLDPEQDAMRIARARKAARVVADVLPEPGRAFADTRRVSAAALVERVAMPAFQALGDEQQFAVAQVNGLAPLEMNIAVSEPGDADLAQALAAARRFAHYLQLARMSTLATFYFDYLRERTGQGTAEWVEALCDADAHGHYPERAQLIGRGDVEDLELIGYVLARNAVQLDRAESMQREFAEAPHPIDYKKARASEVAKTFQRSHLAYAELFLEDDALPVPFEVVQEVVKLQPAWRYAGRVRLGLAARVAGAKSHEPLALVDGFVSAFGNERFAWQHAFRAAPTDAAWLGGLRERLVREVSALPHDRAAWEALGVVHLLSDDEPSWLAAIAARAAAQCSG
jgi:hypothetical protein